MFDWLNANPGVAVAVLTLVVTILGIFITVYMFRASRSDSAYTAALSAKNATIELLGAQNEVLSREKSTYEAKQQAADEHNKLTDETIAILHKRISELEAKQFFESDGAGHVILKNKGLTITRDKG